MECSKLKSELNSRFCGNASPRFRHWTRTIVQMAVVTAFAAMVVSGCRIDMHVQPKYVTEQPTEFFHDGRSERPLVPGTVARGQLRLDELLYTGKENGVESNRFPFPITRADLERGRERFNIYCTPCHDYTGNGNGMIVQRGLSHPPSYNIDRLRNVPVGHFVNVMTNGFGAMYSYASRVSPQDRWRIAAYIRALQLSQHASIQDVPTDERQKLGVSSSASAAPAGQPPAAASAAGAVRAGQPPAAASAQTETGRKAHLGATGSAAAAPPAQNQSAARSGETDATGRKPHLGATGSAAAAPPALNQSAARSGETDATGRKPHLGATGSAAAAPPAQNQSAARSGETHATGRKPQ